MRIVLGSNCRWQYLAVIRVWRHRDVTGETESLVLEHLRYMRGKIDVMSEDIQALSFRLSSVVHHLGARVRRSGSQNGEIDRLKRRVDRIERRLELGDRD